MGFSKDEIGILEFLDYSQFRGHGLKEIGVGGGGGLLHMALGNGNLTFVNLRKAIDAFIRICTRRAVETGDQGGSCPSPDTFAKNSFFSPWRKPRSNLGACPLTPTSKTISPAALIRAGYSPMPP